MSNRFANCYLHPDEYAYANSNYTAEFHTDSYLHPQANSDCNRNCNIHAYANSNYKAQSHTNSHLHAYPDRDCNGNVHTD